MMNNAEHTMGVYGEEERARGRPTFDESRERQRGLEFRDELKASLEREGRARPEFADMPIDMEELLLMMNKDEHKRNTH